ncbi:hypothetical protein Tco_0749322 [Tanacetum coccineum]|uniref:BTB domain-containing protein n=1 Tax=Tanacetum coccineum TaxID=301880 RepID=A0ABQ4YZD3_9ASTR
MPQKEETFQVVIDIIKNSTCFKAFTIFADVPEIFMQQLWYTIKKVQDTDCYEFLLANKKCIVNAGVFRTILDIYPRVEGVDFMDVPDDDTALTFLIDLGYKGPLNRHNNMFMDHMHQPWRTLGMFNRENVDYPELMWEDFAYQIDHRKEKRSRPSKIISNVHQIFIKYSTNQIPPKKSICKGSKGKKTTNESQETVNVSEESEPEPEPAKKKTSSKRRVKKNVTQSADDNIIFDDPDVALELAKSISLTEAEEAEAARKVHATHARIVTKFVPESAKKKSSGRSSKSIVIQDTPSAPKSKPANSKTNLKGTPSLTPAEQEAANIMQALKESKKTSRRQPGTGGSNEGTGSKPGVPDESIVVSASSSEGTGTKPGVPDEEKDIIEEKVILEWGDKQDIAFSDDDNDDVEKDDKDGDADDEGDDHVNDTQDADDERSRELESDNEDITRYKDSWSCKGWDVKCKDVEVEETDKGEEKVTDATKEEAEKTLEAKDDTKKTELPPSSSSLSVSSGFGDQFLKLSSDSSLVSTVKDSADADVIAKLEKDVSELKTVDHSTEALAILKSQVPSVVDNYLGSKVGDVFQKELKKHTTDLIQKYSLQQFSESSKKQTPTVDLEQGSEKSASEILQIKREQAEKQQKPKFTIKSTDKAALEEYDLKSALYQSMHANKSFNRNPANHRLYHALMEALIEDENAMDKGVADTVKDHKRKHDDDEDDDDEDPPAGPNQGKKTKRRRTKESESSKKPSSTKETPKGKAPTKGSKTGKSASAKEPVEEPIAEVVMDDAGDDVARDDNQPQDTSEPKTRKTLNPDWFKQPPRPPTPDPEWNKRQVVLDQPAQPWFNQMVSASKDPLTFNDLMATPIDFSKYVLNGLKIENLTQDILLGPAFNLLKGTCSSSIELEYNFQECFNALTDKLDWNNPEGDRYPFDLSKPLPLQGPLGHRTVAADYFFNNDLEYLKTSDPEVTYTTSIMKTKAARHYILSTKKLHGYGHLEEIVVKISDQQLYKFKEGNFVDLHLNDIEDVLLLVVQHKLLHLDESVIVDFIVALRMFTRSLILKRRVEDLQLGVESYQKKLNITKPQKSFPEIKFKELYTPSYDHQELSMKT